jgi:DNA-binding NarL/FixJ family response regulator
MAISVSIVEDQNEIRNSLIRLIQNEPQFQLISSYSSADEALPMLEKSQPDIVIMDINLPGKLNGIECIQILKERDCKSQFMMFTIYEDDSKIFDAIQAGASGYLLKKTAPEKITESITELYHGGSPMNMNIARKVISHFQAKTKPLPELTDKQNKILVFLSKGYLYKEIASKLGITTGTVTQHIHAIYERLHVGNRTEAINKYLHQ